jgi:hypothetical protein
MPIRTIYNCGNTDCNADESCQFSEEYMTNVFKRSLTMESNAKQLIEEKLEELKTKRSKINSEIGVANRLEHKFEAYILHEKVALLTNLPDDLKVEIETLKEEIKVNVNMRIAEERKSAELESKLKQKNKWL